MKITVKEPSTGALLNLDAKPEKLNGAQGYRIQHENGSSFFISHSAGTWRSGDSHHIEPEFLVNIGLALEGNELSEQIDSTDSNTDQ
ncbi:hypothetical protein IM792_09980 [Mucilaginibacter sp. JRF]|uniref:hypothetical protein n=1 Tax=Mucilaginibacter sp. JRF TaxID=2780088 RepID=UPI0018815C30|nr:hypothetical protein [Mucilaginibacter sp. JRF]MBE9584774.1 hypothetical protein [Mucilaginibacter sp. JRF]